MTSTNLLVTAPGQARTKAGAVGTVRAGMAVLLAFGLAALPLAAGPMPPLFDYPNHLARVDAIARFVDDPGLQQVYELSSFALPNVLSDLVLLGFMRVMSPDLAGIALLALTFALTIGGIASLARVAHGAFSPWSLLAGVFVTNEMVFWGFLNYNLGLALLPWGLALWIHLGHARRRTAQILTGAAFAVLVFFAHFVAFGLFAVGVGVLELHEAWRRRRSGPFAALRPGLAAGLAFVPALAIYAWISPSGRLPLDLRFDFSVWGKLTPFARVLSSGIPALDTPMLVGIVVLAALALATRFARLHAGLALVTASYLALVLVLPYSALGSFFLDWRIVTAAAFLAIAALGPGPSGRPMQALVTPLVLALVTVRSAILFADWRDQEEALAAVRDDLRVLPQGALLIAGSARPFELGDWWTTRRIRPAHEHTAAYAAIDRQVIVPTLFARKGQNPLVYAPDDPSLKALERNPLPRLFGPEDYRAFVSPAEAVAAGGVRPVYAIAFHAPCDAWPAGLPVRPVTCRQGYSLMEIRGPDNPGRAVEAQP